MRLFTAINFDDSVKNVLADVQGSLKSSGVRGRFTVPENLHLTLVFIGDVATAQLPALKAAIGGVSFEPFELTVTGLGTFGRANGAVLWVGITPCPELGRVRAELYKRITDAEFPADDREFSPHLTLARDAVLPRGFVLAGYETPAITVRVTRIGLMESVFEGGKVFYREIFTGS